MVILLSLLSPQESPVIWHRNGEHLRILLDSSKIRLAISTGRYSHFINKTASDSSGFCLFSTSTSHSYSGSWSRTVSLNYSIDLFPLEKERMIEHWRYRLGEVSKQHGAGHRDRRFPVDRKKNYVRYSNFHQTRRNKRLNMIWTNWWCRDQNFRKYFEMRKRHGIRPSLSGFYHEQIYADVEKKNWELSQRRASRTALWVITPLLCWFHIPLAFI